MRKLHHLLARTREVRDDVVVFAVEGVHVHGHFGPVEVLGQVGLDGGLGLGFSHARDVDAAVVAEGDRAVWADHVLAADLLHAPRLSQGHGHFRALGEHPDLVLKDALNLFRRQIRHAELAAVGRAEVDGAVRIDGVQPVDRVGFKHVLATDVQYVKRFDAVRRQRDHSHGIDEQNVRRLNDVWRQADLIQFFRNGRVRKAARIEFRGFAALVTHRQALATRAASGSEKGENQAGREPPPGVVADHCISPHSWKQTTPRAAVHSPAFPYYPV